jgi:hypothetical protein
LKNRPTGRFPRIAIVRNGTAVVVGHGTSPFAFWEQGKTLPFTPNGVLKSSASVRFKPLFLFLKQANHIDIITSTPMLKLNDKPTKIATG